MKINFNEMPWHDAELLNINIDRRDPGNNDQIAIDVCWPNDKKNRLVFNDCYELEVKMNFGIIAPESILQASAIDESQKLMEIRSKWAQIGVDLKHLNCFEIEMNSTGSVLRIYALSCTVYETRKSQ